MIPKRLFVKISSDGREVGVGKSGSDTLSLSAKRVYMSPINRTSRGTE